MTDNYQMMHRLVHLVGIRRVLGGRSHAASIAVAFAAIACTGDASPSAVPSQPLATEQPAAPESSPTPRATGATPASTVVTPLPVTLLPEDRPVAPLDARTASVVTAHFILTDAGLSELHRWPADLDGGLARLRNPDRFVFVQRREGVRWAVAVDRSLAEPEPLFEMPESARISSWAAGGGIQVVEGKRTSLWLAATRATRVIEDFDSDYVAEANPDWDLAVVRVGKFLRLLDGEGTERPLRHP